ncbi:amino acid ABC transporter ATP-binding protein [Pseudomonas kribbensis]|uniref:Amino acid ABC transporter ATP-binding protein n=1 Tax=Pseudomonas kribbensis TaxID=1628086 RepID=A0A4Y8VTF2_9PSED|nr:amino acid ABC transporter ATP-binding protein [Pseudomonas kribbensis]TFH83531.1 amino acid ABC transporter ATP-binding protein [Pseudomonas kribbensis]
MSALIEFQGFNKFFGEQQVLKGIDLQVKSGEVIVILGPSGCGKSTLLRCLNGLEVAHGGSLKFAGRELLDKATDWREVRQQIGMVFQSYHLFPHMSVLDNLLLGPLKVQKRERREAQQQAEALLERVGLLEKRDAFPRQLSGGQQQRIAIVRSLCMNPRVMLFDEVTAALDPEMVKEVLQVIQGLAREGMTLLIVTHEMAFARAVADRIVFMDAGRILEQNPPELFFTNPQTARAQQFLEKFSYVEALPSTTSPTTTQTKELELP